MAEISVIIPNYNHASFLEERIRSVLQQTFTDIELIIMDDASTDSSRNIIEQFRNDPRVRHIVYNTTNSGSLFRQWYRGFGYTTGGWVWIAESDDITSPLFLEKMIAATGRKTDLAYIYCDSLIEKTGSDKSGSFAEFKNQAFRTNKWSSAYALDGKQEINESLKWECVVNNASAVLFNRSHLKKVIKGIESFSYHGDWMLYLLLAGTGNVSYLPEALNTYREHSANHSASDPTMRAFRVEHFKILAHLLKQDFVTEEEKLFDHFLTRYIGFGLLKEPAFGKKGIFRHYAAIDSKLARKVVIKLLINKLKI